MKGVSVSEHGQVEGSGAVVKLVAVKAG